MDTNQSTTLKKEPTQEDCRRLVEREVYYCQSSLVDWLMKDNLFSIDDIENLSVECSSCHGASEVPVDEDHSEPCGECDDGYIHNEIYEWWLVSNWLAEKLRERDEPILDNDYGTWWGRTCTGQAICLDSVIESIAREVLNY